MSFFLAVDLDPPARAVAAGLVEQLRSRTSAKWLRPDKLHLTLWFLGHPTAEALAALESPVAQAAAKHAPFSLRLEGAGTFATARAAAVLWLGVQGQLDGLGALQRDVTAAAGGTQDKPYVPHVTLARGEDAAVMQAHAQALQGRHTGDFTVDHVTLYESRNDTYRVVFQVPLAR
ncbi:MAG: RNA 2',3'-cyclic phosphodiesterase [Myxococcaceae bacterium]|nr:RNA 2',3'-cyclic phosphodiesterase [Myxococcaceae bacterium]